MKKKLLSLILATTMVAGCLAGCGSQSTAEAPAAEAKAAEASAEATTETAAPATEEAEEVVEVVSAGNDAIQNLISATTAPVDLRVWASEEDQELTTKLLGDFKAQYPDVTFNIELGAESESKAKDDILVDVEAAPDVFAFADDQINELVKAGALQEVAATYTFDVTKENVSGAVAAATQDGKLYAYPMTADNGYFMFYDSSVFTADDMKSMDAMIEKAKASNKKIAMHVSNGWYIYAFFQGNDLALTLNDDGTNTCEWNKAGGADVCQSIMDLFNTGVFVNLSDEDQATAIAEGTICAAVNGTWRAETAKEAWGENYAATKLPTYTVAGAQKQMSSFSGYKLIGVNPHSKNVGWAMLLAEFLTNEDSQMQRFAARGLGPSNIKAGASSDVQADPAISALAAQAEFATPQRVGGNYWSPAETLGSILAEGNPDGTDLQQLLDTAVEGINAPIE